MQRLWSGWYKRIVLAIPVMDKSSSTSGQTSLDELSLEGSSLTAAEGQTMTHHRAVVTGPSVAEPVTAPNGTSTTTANPDLGTITGSITLPVANRVATDDDVPDTVPQPSGKLSQILGFCRDHSSLLVLGFSGLAMVVGVGIGYVFITTPRVITGATQTCQSRVIGSWQTGVGLLQLQPAGNGTDTMIGKYQYANSVQGNVTGQITGTMDQNVMSFTWQETAKSDDAKANTPSKTTQGKGILFFSPNCQEMSGTSGQGEEIKGHRRWDGTWQATKK
ncbi:MAG: hypothetical protein ACK5QS_05875 [Pseudanabaenaceae cyanobacterium]|jgi:hypothetical protein